MRYLLAAALLFAATPVLAADPPAPPEKKICRIGEIRTGSNMPAPRKCHTASEWAAIDAQTPHNRGEDQKDELTRNRPPTM